MIAVNSNVTIKHAKKIFCPECRSRICDMIIPEQEQCYHKYKVIFDENSEYFLTIKCKKCGKIIGLGITP